MLVLASCSDDATSSGPDGGSDNPPGTPPAVGPDGAVILPPTPPAESLMNMTTESIDVDGAERTYVLAVPKAYDAARSYPLIVALHGDGDNAAGFAMGSGLEQAVGSDAILAFTDRSEDLFTPYDDNPDQKLVERVIDAVKASYTVDATKVWGFGFSKGAFQLNELACRKPGLFAAMAVHAGGAPQERDVNDEVYCPAAIGLPMFVVQGELDQGIGGEFAAQYWASRAGCAETRSPSTPTICQAFDGCDPSTPVVFCVVPGHPHSPLYPGAAVDSWSWFNSL